MSWKQERGYSTNEYVGEHIQGNLYNKALNNKVKILCNTHRLQKMVNGDNTCGRWASLCVRFYYLNNDEFAALFLNQKYNPDSLVTLMTFLSITDDVTYEKQILS